MQIKVTGNIAGVHREWVDTISNAINFRRTEILEEVFRRVKIKARHNIKEGAKLSRYPQTGNLGNSITGEIVDGQLMIEVGAFYGAIRNEDVETVFEARNGKQMSFYWHRVGHYDKFTVTKQRGNQFFDRAVDDTMGEMDQIIHKNLSRAGRINAANARREKLK